jgi:hypothetical protein
MTAWLKTVALNYLPFTTTDSNSGYIIYGNLPRCELEIMPGIGVGGDWREWGLLWDVILHQ